MFGHFALRLLDVIGVVQPDTIECCARQQGRQQGCGHLQFHTRRLCNGPAQGVFHPALAVGAFRQSDCFAAKGHAPARGALIVVAEYFHDVCPTVAACP